MYKQIRIIIVGFCLLVLNVNPLFAQWVKLADSPEANVLAVSGTNIFAGTWGNGIFLSTDNGSSWGAVDSGLTNPIILTLTVSGNNIYAGGAYDNQPIVFLSTNNGTNWSIADSGIPRETSVYAIAVSGNNSFAGTWGSSFGYGIFLSSNNGSSWNAVNTGLNSNMIQALIFSGTNLFAATNGGKVFLSTNNGTTWNEADNGLPNYLYYGIVAFAVSGTNLFAASGGKGVFLSTDYGTTWNATNNTPLIDASIQKNAFIVSGTNILAGTDMGIFISANNGASWHAFNDSLYSIVPGGKSQNSIVSALCVSGEYIFAGVYGTGVWRRPLSEIVTAINKTSNNLPEQFKLQQNYPNPFNPSTTISFSLPSRLFTTLKIYNILGKEIATLVDEYLPGGNHSYQWNAKNLPSGIYFYRLQAGGLSQTKKLVLLQ